MEENSEKIRVTAEWMRAKYDEMNELLFGGSLGHCDLAPFTTGKGSQGRTLGWFKMKGGNLKIDRRTRQIFQNTPLGRVWVYEGNFVDVCRPMIEINGNYTATEEALTATLVHEMCHYYTYMNGMAPVQAHGREFKNIGARVSARSGGRFTIQRLASAEEMTNWELDADIQAKNDARLERKKNRVFAILAFKNNGEIQLTMTSNSDVLYTLTEWNSRAPKYNKIIKSSDPECINYLFEKGYRRNMRTWRYWSLESKPWVNELQNFKWDVIFNQTNESIMKDMNLKGIVESVIKEYIGSEVDDDTIDINPNMNLGLDSPFEAD